nr:radical SAM/SPASM domain-containing protein [uncultured Desulfuromonas sp.]
MSISHSSVIAAEPVPALRRFPSKLFVETTTFCNLSCPMCVKHAEGSTIEEGNLSQQTFEALKPAFPHLDALFLNGIGEPLLHPQLASFVAQARREMPADAWIGFQSNGLLFTEDNARELIDAGTNRICLSIDSLSPALFRKIRQGGQVGAVHHAFKVLDEARRNSATPDVKLGMELVAVRQNVHELPELIQWAADQGVDFALVTQMLPYDSRYCDNVAYDINTDAAVTIFEQGCQKAHRLGIDLVEWLQNAWTRQKPGDDVMTRLIQEMKSQARDQGVFFNLTTLAARSREQQQQVEEHFERARQVAEQCGLTLNLPSLVATQQRHCAFVEDGGAFISWDGTIHPCYNLWHNYRCFLNGWENRVATRQFGNINELGLEALWNRDDFIHFRRNVLEYDYPFCSCCTVAPCDYIDNDAFEEDCYLRSEPCGTCLWAMGLLQCLH